MTAVISACIKNTLIKIGEFLCSHFNIEDGINYAFQHIMLFYFKKGKNTTEAQKHICAVCGEGVVTDPTCQKWFVKFRAGDFLLDDAPSKFISKLLLPEQKEHVAVASDLIQTTTNEADFLKKVITRSGWWAYSYDTETKTQLFPWKPWFSAPEEGVAKSQQDQDHVNCVF